MNRPCPSPLSLARAAVPSARARRLLFCSGRAGRGPKPCATRRYRPPPAPPPRRQFFYTVCWVRPERPGIARSTTPRARHSTACALSRADLGGRFGGGASCARAGLGKHATEGASQARHQPRHAERPPLLRPAHSQAAETELSLAVSSSPPLFQPPSATSSTL